jgi:hypothetical protein
MKTAIISITTGFQTGLCVLFLPIFRVYSVLKLCGPTKSIMAILPFPRYGCTGEEDNPRISIAPFELIGLKKMHLLFVDGEKGLFH